MITIKKIKKFALYLKFWWLSYFFMLIKYFRKFVTKKFHKCFFKFLSELIRFLIAQKLFKNIETHFLKIQWFMFSTKFFFFASCQNCFVIFNLPGNNQIIIWGIATIVDFICQMHCMCSRAVVSNNTSRVLFRAHQSGRLTSRTFLQLGIICLNSD